MMLTTQTMTPGQELDARAKAFYLLKKYTSLTCLNHAVGLYRDLLNAYEKQLDTPSPNQQWLEKTYQYCFLRRLIELEQGIEILQKGMGREAAYSALVEGGKFSDYLFGRAADEWGVEHDPFFVALGAREVRFSNPEIAAGHVKGAVHTHLCLEVLKCTVNFPFVYALVFGQRQDGGERVFSHWTFESLFQDAPSPGWPGWPPGRTYPAVLPPSPPKNTSSEGEVLSGEEITADGIWEPWFISGKVGCPNYFLNGQVAHTYQPEGTHDEEPVRWRLLWQDTRYLDGTVPAEEADYLDKPAPPVRLRAIPGEPCPRTGYWHSIAVNQPAVHVNVGEPMPGPERTSVGAVIWSFVGDAAPSV